MSKSRFTSPRKDLFLLILVVVVVMSYGNGNIAQASPILFEENNYTGTQDGDDQGPIDKDRLKESENTVNIKNPQEKSASEDLKTTVITANNKNSQSNEPWHAIAYIEKPEAGPEFSSGRVLSTGGNYHYAIDINSLVEVKISNEDLYKGLLSYLKDFSSDIDIKAIEDRLDRLIDASKSIQPAFDKFKKANDMWASYVNLKTTKDEEIEEVKDKADKAVEEANAALSKLLYEGLRNAIIERLMYHKLSRDMAKEEAFEIRKRITRGPQRILGYDWNEMAKVFEEEIEYAKEDLMAILSKVGLKIQLQAHLVSGDGTTIAPIHLPGYNAVESCIATPYQKVTFDVPEEQKKAYEMFDKAVESFRENKGSDSTGILQALRETYLEIHPGIKSSFKPVLDAAGDLKTQVLALAAWADEDKLESWLKLFLEDLVKEERETIIKLWKDAKEEIFDPIVRDFEALNSFANLGDLSGESLDMAMSNIMSILEQLHEKDFGKNVFQIFTKEYWECKLKKVEKLYQDIKDISIKLRKKVEDPSNVGLLGPFEQFANVKASLKNLSNEINNLPDKFISWLADFLGNKPELEIGNMKLPEGQISKDIFDSNLSTKLNLQTICGRRQDGDIVRLTYTFFQGDGPLNTGWTDDFVIRTYGWQSEFIASLAVVGTNFKGNSWKPSPALTWILNKKSWPRDNESGIRGGARGIEWIGGFGFTVLYLDFYPDVDIELGIAGTIALLNKRILCGAGWNFSYDEVYAEQNDVNRVFFFLSLRIGAPFF